MAFVEFHNVGKTYHMGEVQINALHDTSFAVEKGELVPYHVRLHGGSVRALRPGEGAVLAGRAGVQLVHVLPHHHVDGGLVGGHGLQHLY